MLERTEGLSKSSEPCQSQPKLKIYYNHLNTGESADVFEIINLILFLLIYNIDFKL